MLTIQLKKKHFFTDSWNDINFCPIANALKERYKVGSGEVVVGIDFAYVKSTKRIMKESYLEKDYNKDMKKIKSEMVDPETVIREIKFI